MVMRMSLEDHLGTSTVEKSRRAHRITPSETIWENKDFFCEILVFARRPGPSGIFCTPHDKEKKRKTHMGYGISEHRLVSGKVSATDRDPDLEVSGHGDGLMI
jgi:hypothetical protein